MIQTTLPALNKEISERPLLADQVERQLGTRDAAEAAKLLKEKAPREALRVLEEVNRNTGNAYKGLLRSSRRQLDSWETQILTVGVATMLLILIAVVLTIFDVKLAALIFDGFAFAALAADVILSIKTRRLRLRSEDYFNWFNEHTRDARLLSLIVNAVARIGVDEAQNVIVALLFSEEL